MATATDDAAAHLPPRTHVRDPPWWSPVSSCAATIALRLRDPHDSGSWGYCPWKLLTGLDCPGCGALRAVNDLTHGDLARRREQQPAVRGRGPGRHRLWLRLGPTQLERHGRSRVPRSASTTVHLGGGPRGHGGVHGAAQHLRGAAGCTAEADPSHQPVSEPEAWLTPATYRIQTTAPTTIDISPRTNPMLAMRLALHGAPFEPRICCSREKPVTAAAVLTDEVADSTRSRGCPSTSDLIASGEVRAGIPLPG